MKTKHEVVAFEDDPVGFCQQIYAESKTRIDDLASIDEENRLFYEGQDSRLDERKADKRVKRSGLFIHELKQAIDTRKSDVIARLEEREYPVTVRPRGGSHDKVAHEQALWIERKINEQLRECGFLAEGFGDLILSAEIYRSPSTVKVGWDDAYDMQPVVKQPNELKVIAAAMMGRTPPSPRVVWEPCGSGTEIRSCDKTKDGKSSRQQAAILV